MSLVRFVVVYGSLLIGASGCGLFSSRQHHGSGPVDTTDRRRVGVAVESHNWNDITVYLITGGLPQRLGMVTALSKATFDFPSHRLNTSTGVRLRALPVAGRAFTSDNILVLPGQVITWTLENNLSASSFSVY
ncbi:MAG: hypothetical protein ACJ8BF_06030 [Gemmatimonadales bacterium]